MADWLIVDVGVVPALLAVRPLVGDAGTDAVAATLVGWLDCPVERPFPKNKRTPRRMTIRTAPIASAATAIGPGPPFTLPCPNDEFSNNPSWI